MQVVVRCRPLIKRQVKRSLVTLIDCCAVQLNAREKSVVRCVEDCTVKLPGSKDGGSKEFVFDRVFDESAQQQEVRAE